MRSPVGFEPSVAVLVVEEIIPIDVNGHQRAGNLWFRESRWRRINEVGEVPGKVGICQRHTRSVPVETLSTLVQNSPD